MVDEPNHRKSGDLTSLNELPANENLAFGVSEDEAPPALDGLDDLMHPMSPTSAAVHDAAATEGVPELSESALLDPIAHLPPIDADTLAAAAGRDSLPDLGPDEARETPIDAPSIDSTAVGAAIADALASSTLESVRNYSDHLAPGAGPEAVSTPFSLSIEGPLRDHERETLLALVSRENLGVREIELEPQFAAGRILIPRISEYAGVLIVQALRNTKARIRLGPSESIYSPESGRDADHLILPTNADAEIFITEERDERADAMILTAAEDVPGRTCGTTIDTLHGAMNLTSISLSQPQSPAFLDALDRLKTQLKLRAHHRGANALIGFKYSLLPLEGHSTYKLVVEARAVRLE